jgi:hypothetical protein
MQRVCYQINLAFDVGNIDVESCEEFHPSRLSIVQASLRLEELECFVVCDHSEFPAEEFVFPFEYGFRGPIPGVCGVRLLVGGHLPPHVDGTPRTNPYNDHG